MLGGCGISKGQYEEALQQKEALQSQVTQVTKDFQKLRADHQTLLTEKEGLKKDLEKATGEKETLRLEYDRILNDTIILKREHDRLHREKQVLELHLDELQTTLRTQSQSLSQAQAASAARAPKAPQDKSTPDDKRPRNKPPVENLFSVDYGKLLLEDGKCVFSSPVRWDQKEWLVFGLETSAVVGTAAVVDRPLQKKIQKNRNNTTDDIANLFEPFGSEYSFGILGAFYLEGLAFQDDKAKAVAQDGLASSLIAAGITTPLKFMVGRSRPEANKGSHHFDPFSKNESFPSGHTTQAFVTASVLSEYYDPLWVKIAAYGTASLVGYARMEQNAHYLSDVLAGAFIGTAVGKTIVHFNKEKRIQLSVIVEEKQMALKVTYGF